MNHTPTQKTMSRLFNKLFLTLILLSSSLYFNLSSGLSQELPTPPSHENFISFFKSLEQDFIEQGVSQTIFDNFINSIRYNPQIIKYDRNQPESTFSLNSYLNSLVSQQRIERGKNSLEIHSKLLKRVYKEFGVPPHVLVAFWGIESFYGKHTGKIDIHSALATLTFDKRRRSFFNKQLTSLLLISEEIPQPQIQGSWAGAMGHMQFMPSTYRQYAIDFDGDNKKDLWNSHHDIFASAGNFLKNMGWKTGQRWGRPVIIPEQMSFDKGDKKNVTQWKNQGIKLWDGSELPNSDIKARIISYGQNQPAFLAYHNFDVILKWNRSNLYAIAVGLLSDHFAQIKTPSDFSKSFKNNHSDL